jgi:alpha-N-arabinofuranosidase
VRAENGHPEPYNVKFWEIDNEVWRLKPDDYVSILKQFVPAMKKVDPSIVIIACGSGQLGRNWGDGDTAVITQAAELSDYLSVHHYESPAKYADGPAAAEKFWRSLGEKIAASRNAKMRLFVSEWNAQTTDWRTGLYAGGALNVFERCTGIVGMAAPALFLRHVSASGWDNAFINFDHRTWFPAPNYVVMKLWRDHYAPQRLEVVGEVSGLEVMATKSADGRKLYLKVVNPTDVAADVRVDLKGGFAPARTEMLLVAPDSLDARNSLDKPDAIAPAPGKVSRDGKTVRFAMPRWSAGVVTLEE